MKKVFASVALSGFVGLCAFTGSRLDDGASRLKDNWGVPEENAARLDLVDDVTKALFMTMGSLATTTAVAGLGLLGQRRKDDLPAPHQP